VEWVGGKAEKREYLPEWKQKEEKPNRTGESHKDANTQGGISKGTPQDLVSVRQLLFYLPEIRVGSRQENIILIITL